MCRHELDIEPGIAESAVEFNSTLGRHGLKITAFLDMMPGIFMNFPQRLQEVS
jgi:hypothetical protein